MKRRPASANLMTNRRNRQAEIRYRTSLRRIARAVGDIVNGRYDGSNDSITEIIEALERYSEIITPWATKVAENFTADLTRQNEKVWRQHSKNISRELRNLVESAPVGQVMQSIIAEQVKYIKSLPLEAADRVYDIQNRAIEAVVTGGRAEHFAKEIAASGDIAKSRADLIARTELGRATGALDQHVRCQLVRMVISGVQPKMVTSGILIGKWKVNLSNGANLQRLTV